MSKERLEEIRNRMIVEKQHFKYLNNEKGYWENVYTLLERDMKYLFDTIIEQAEQNKLNQQALINQERSSDREIERLRKRVQELEKSEEEWISFQVTVNNTILNLEEQNKRYHESLETLFNESLVFSGYEDLDAHNPDLFQFASAVNHESQQALEGEE